MNRRKSSTSNVDVGTPPRGFQHWDSVDVHFHGSSALTTETAESPEFTCLGNEWTLSISPDYNVDYDYDPGDFINILISLTMKFGDRIDIGFCVSVINLDGRDILHDSNQDCFSPGDCICLLSDDVEHSTLMESVDKGTLTVVLRMRNIGPVNNSLPIGAFVPENPLCGNILKRFMDEESADVVFEVSNEEKERGGKSSKRAKASLATFHAHCLILLDGAPMLAELCKSSEGTLGPVSITDVKPKIFRLVLRYAYGGQMSDDELEANARELVDVADRFGMVSLKLLAEACYVNSTKLTVENMLDNLLYADSKNCALLKEAVMDFVVENREDILGKVSFDNVPGSVVTDLLTAMSRVMKKGGGVVDSTNLATARVGSLRKMLHKRGLNVDGSREAMIAALDADSMS